MTQGLGAAILCLLLAGLGYGVGPRGGTRAREPEHVPAADRTPEAEDLPSTGRRAQRRSRSRLRAVADDSSSPLAAEADYGWPVEQPEIAHNERQVVRCAAAAAQPRL
jgi:hypothetical protein